MKTPKNAKALFQPRTDTLSIQDLKPKMNIGWRYEDAYGFIIKTETGFEIPSYDYESQKSIHFNTFQEVKERITAHTEMEVFIFDTPQELYKWVSEQTN